VSKDWKDFPASKIVAEVAAGAKQWGFDTEKLIYVEHDMKGGNQ
jgi:hypothetical protein